MHRIESVSGSPVVLLDWTPWQSSVLADALAVRYRVISIEPPEDNGLTASARSAAEGVASVAEAAGLDSYSLVGVSLGADVAFRLALLRPASVTTLALVSPTCVGYRKPQIWNTPELAMNVMLAHPGDNTQIPPAPSRTEALATMSERWAAADSHALRPRGPDAAELLPGLSCATLAVFGQEDRLVSREAGGVWKERAPNCNLCYVYDAGHAVTVDRPDALVNVVLDFLERRETFIVENRSSLINP